MIEHGLCSKKRPDFVYDAGSHAVVVEVDEFQHKRENYGCEQTRMWDITQALGLPTIFIRYNPDTFTNHREKRGICADKRRQETLVKWLRHLMSEKGTPTSEAEYLRVIYLFYDGWESSEKASVDIVLTPWTQNRAEVVDPPEVFDLTLEMSKLALVPDDDPIWDELGL